MGMDRKTEIMNQAVVGLDGYYISPSDGVVEDEFKIIQALEDCQIVVKPTWENAPATLTFNLLSSEVRFGGEEGFTEIEVVTGSIVAFRTM